jgi:hypothetical protein
MCDYSLGGLPNRLAIEGEELVVHRFSTGSIGLAASADVCPNSAAEGKKTFWQVVKNFFDFSVDTRAVPAVCVPPGAQLSWKPFPARLQHKWGLADDEKDLGVRFVQTNADENRYRDALELPNGRQILLQDLAEGLRLKLTSFGGDLCQDEESSLPRGVIAG